jgi:hypothetical protein
LNLPSENLVSSLCFHKLNLYRYVAALEELIAKLEAKRDAKKKKCASADAGGMSKNVLNHCVEVVENERLQERHEVGLYRLNAGDPQLETAWFLQPLSP